MISFLISYMPDNKLLMKGEILSWSFMGVNENLGVNRPLGGPCKLWTTSKFPYQLECIGHFYIGKCYKNLEFSQHNCLDCLLMQTYLGWNKLNGIASNKISLHKFVFRDVKRWNQEFTCKQVAWNLTRVLLHKWS